jgi:hypothetical protein
MQRHDAGFADADGACAVQGGSRHAKPKDPMIKVHLQNERNAASDGQETVDWLPIVDVQKTAA